MVLSLLFFFYDVFSLSVVFHSKILLKLKEFFLDFLLSVLADLLNHSESKFGLLDRWWSPAGAGGRGSPLRSLWGVNALVLPLSVSHPNLRGQWAVWIDATVQGLVLHVTEVRSRLFTILHCLVDWETLSLLKERVVIELPLKRKLPQQLCPVTHWSSPRCNFLYRKVNIIIISFPQYRMWRNTFINMAAGVSTGYVAHFLVVG